MKKSLITAVVLAACCAAPAAFAEPNTDMGTLIINGKIQGTTCHFDSSYQTAKIIMHQIGLDVFNTLQPGNAYDGYKNKTTTSFKIKCGENQSLPPKLKFISSEFDQDTDGTVTKTMTGEGQAQGVGYALFINGNRIDADGSTKIAENVAPNGEYTFDIDAQYARASGNSVTAGQVNSTVTFTVVAD